MSLATGTFRPRGRKPRIPIMQPGHRLNDGLVARWLFVEGTGNVQDFSPNGFHTTARGSPQWATGPEGPAVDFGSFSQHNYYDAGRDSSLLVGTLSQWSLAARVLVRSTSNFNAIAGVTTLSISRPEWNLGLIDGSFVVALRNEANDLIRMTSPTPANLNKWTWVVGTKVGNVLSLFIDGRLATQTYTEITPELGAFPFRMGSDVRGTGGIPSGNFPLDGLLSDVGVWSRALSPDEIHELSMGLYEEFTPQIRRPMVVVPDLDVVRVTQLVRETLQAPASETQRITQVVREYLYSEGQRVTQFPVEMLVSNKDPYHRVTQYVVEMLVSSDPRPSTYDIIRKANQGLGRGIIYG